MLLLVFFSACGYQMEGQVLPKNLSALALAPIGNRTAVAELDVRLRQHLRGRLLANPRLRLMPQSRAEAELVIVLTKAEFQRSVALFNTALSSLTLTLTGTVRLERNTASPRLLRKAKLVVVESLNFSEAMLETPAVRETLLEETLTAFSQRVERLLYAHF